MNPTQVIAIFKLIADLYARVEYLEQENAQLLTQIQEQESEPEADE